MRDWTLSLQYAYGYTILKIRHSPVYVLCTFVKNNMKIVYEFCSKLSILFHWSMFICSVKSHDCLCKLKADWLDMKKMVCQALDQSLDHLLKIQRRLYYANLTQKIPKSFKNISTLIKSQWNKRHARVWVTVAQKIFSFRGTCCLWRISIFCSSM